jgi:hypothetical protein
VSCRRKSYLTSSTDVTDHSSNLTNAPLLNKIMKSSSSKIIQNDKISDIIMGDNMTRAMTQYELLITYPDFSKRNIN